MDEYNYSKEFEEEDKLQIKLLKQILKDTPNLQDSTREKIELKIKMHQGDINALMKLSVIHGLTTQEDYDLFESTKANDEEDG